MNAPSQQQGPKLTKEQIDELNGELVPTKDATTVRFLYNGQALSIGSGALASKGSNVIYHTHYWNFSDQSIDKILRWLGDGVKAVRSK